MIRNWEVGEGRFFSEEEERRSSRVCVLGTTIVANLFNGENPIGKTIRLRNMPFKVVGVLQSKGANGWGQDQDDVVMAPYTTVSRILQRSAFNNVNMLNLSLVSMENLEEAIPSLDILYMTRIQGERFADKDEYERLKDVYILTKAKLKNAKSDLSIMHPLPRVNEIAIDVDDDERASYFEQAENGRYIRMALILKLLKEKDGVILCPDGEENSKLICKNTHCITRTERGIKRLYKGESCIYCDQKATKN
jgi:hypothetical protein